MDERINLDYHLALADRGVVLEMDTFGQESYWEFPHKDPTDIERCEHLAELLDRGLEGQVVLGCDVYNKMTHVEYGGMGYEHLPGRIAKLLEQHFEIMPVQLHTMLIDNPRRILERPAQSTDLTHSDRQGGVQLQHHLWASQPSTQSAADAGLSLARAISPAFSRLAS